MIQPPPGVGTFQFVILSALRAAQLLKGCRPRIEGIHKPTVVAQIEVAEGKVTQAFGLSDALAELAVPAATIVVPVAVPAA